jgi:hypothetical protein
MRGVDELIVNVSVWKQALSISMGRSAKGKRAHHSKNGQPIQKFQPQGNPGFYP